MIFKINLTFDLHMAFVYLVFFYLLVLKVRISNVYYLNFFNWFLVISWMYTYYWFTF